MRKLVLLLAIITLFMTGCNVHNDTEQSLLDLTNKYPTLKEDLIEVSKEQLSTIKVPDYIPFKVKDVQAMTLPDDPSQIEVVFTNGTMNLHMLTMKQEDKGIVDEVPKGKVDIDQLATYDTNQFGRQLQWEDQSTERVYILKLMTYTPEERLPYTKEDIFQIAHSMYKQDAHL